jgi:predicted esterase
MRKFSIFIFCLVIFSFVFCQNSQTEEKTVVDWSNPEIINPFQKDIGDFLDVNLRELWSKAYEAYNSGDYEKSAKYYLALVRCNISDETSIYNLACCYGLLDKDSLATKFLKRAVRAGFDDMVHIKKDPDFEKVKDSDIFITVLDSMSEIIEEKVKKKGEEIYVSSEIFTKCLTHLPDSFDSSKSYTLLVGLHGYGASPQSFVRLWEDFGNHDFFYVSPQAPYPFSVGKETGYSWGLRIPDDEENSKLANEMSEKFVINIVRYFKMKYNIGDVYLLGFSQGASFAFSIGIKNHDVFKGIIPFGGWFDEEWIGEDAIKAGKDLKVFIGHGKDDKSVKYESGTKARDILKENGYDVTFVDFEGGHTVDRDVLKQAIVWILEE